MKHSYLLSNIEKCFSKFKKPAIIYKIPESGVVTNDYLDIQRDFGNLLPSEMTDQQCSMMICDGPLISDEALCYFLARIARRVLLQGGLEDLLYRRLEYLDTTLLNREQKFTVNQLIDALKELEKELEMEEKQELEQSWLDWEQVLVESDNINDKLLLAIFRGSLDDVKILIEQGANVNEKDKNGNSPLDIAKYREQSEIVEFLKQVCARE
ncbi:ankyrin repeat domain-containing protein [Limnofasciculus baicalensis]|uniref:Ankyrin repeat domain-containing protein n=1 Tax=Limnofasciculus baicalensis BBK-W-15 TaxID=2699891 RepID=A0AAE3KQV0_9CYAN|nr:ankyrin repeat domain-containing protein [Limnofasciculus baicalensis]MCP2727757.1 ankyrin repeat domain-containing protein [Limnofasciculus baicalensis BBK-W-15]